MAYKNHAALTQSSALALATGLMLASSPAQAQSFLAEGTVVEGSATITEGIDTTDITVDSDSAVIDWAPFDDSGIGDVFFQDFGTTATFTNGTGITDFAVLNRILAVDPTSRIILNGNIISRIQDGMGGSVPGGTVFFYTPGGIIIGADAVIDVGNLGLTTAEPLTDGMGNFIVGDTVDFQQADGFSDISIEQGAQIDALSEGSYVALFAPRIVQDGEINVNGQAAFVAAEAGTITFSPDGLFDIQVDVGTDAGFGAIEHSGSTGGPASMGMGDNHRIYMVTVAKNTAATLLIQGGSELGFDIAGSASMDGETVVLSGGYNITVGDIGPQAPSGAQTDIILSDSGLGTGLTATSDVLVRADGLASGSFTDLAVFEGDLDIASGRSAVVTNGSLASLTVGGNLSIVSDTPNAGQDVGISDMRLRNGSTANIAGDLFIASRASVDANGDNIVANSTASLSINEVSSLTVGGDLIVDGSNDFSADTVNGFQINAGVARILVNSGSVVVGGVTRIRSDAIAGDNGNAFGNTALLSASGGTFTTGELNISADAFGGDDTGDGAGNATSGGAQINVQNAGSAVTVLGANTIGDAGLGDLDFLSSEAFGGAGTTGNGGDATSGNTQIIVEGGATITLPNDVGNPLFMRNSAIAGDTSASDSVGGRGNTGQTILRVTDSNADLGRLAIRSMSVGGSALLPAERTTGGDAVGGFTQLDFENANVTAAFDEIRIEHLAGAGSADGLGTDGVANGSNVIVDLDSTIFNVVSDMVITGLTLNGDGRPGFGIPLDITSSGGEFNVDGNLSATGAAVNFTVDDGAGMTTPGLLDVTGDLTLQSVTSRFGNDTDDAAFNVFAGSTATIGGNLRIAANATADVNNDGTISNGFVGLVVEGTGTSLTVGGNAVLDASNDQTGGDVGLNARGGSANLSVRQAGSMNVGGVTRLTSNAIGAIDGNATGQFVLLRVQDGSVFTTGELSISSDATGGEGIGGAGGNAESGTVELSVAGTGSTLNVLSGNTIGDAALGELEFMSSEAFGGMSAVGNGGNAIAGSTNINIEDGAVVNLPNASFNPLLIVNTAIGGDTSADNSTAGSAESGFNRFVITDSTVDLGHLSFLVNIIGGSAVAGNQSFGGDALLDFNEFLISGSDVDIVFGDFQFDAAAGAGTPVGNGADGSLITGNYTVNVENSTLDILSDFTISATGMRGDGSSTNSQNLLIGFSGADVSIDGDIDLLASTISLTAAQNIDSGNVTNLDVAGGISMMSTGPNFGTDGGRSEFFITGGSIVTVGASVLLSALANGDFDGNGTNSGGSARLIVEDIGSSLDVTGNLILDSSADLTGTNNGLIAQGGFSELFMQNGAQVTVGGVTRMVTNAIAGDGGSATGGNAQLVTLGGALFTTGELNMSADATGGLDIGGGGGAATGGTVRLASTDTDSLITVLGANITGDAALGELDFMSSEAFGGAGVTGAGGNASSGFVNIDIRNGGSASFADAPGAALRVASTAIGGDTAASDSSGGSATNSNITVEVSNSSADLGRLSLISRAFGGSAIGGAERTNGGSASGGAVQLLFLDADVDAAFDDIILDRFGGNGTGDDGIVGGDANGGPLDFTVTGSTVDILSSVLVSSEARGGDGHQAGSAIGSSGTAFFENSTVNISGSLSIDNTAEGGAGIGTGAVSGGDATSQFVGMQIRNTALNTQGNVSIGSHAIGGDASEGTAGNANAVETFVGMFGGSTITAGAYEASSRATGGSIQSGGAGRGGDANGANATISLDGGVADGPVTFTGDVRLIANAIAGDGGELGGDGGNAVAGGAELRTFEPGTINVGGIVSLSSVARGGDSTLGMGGTSQYGFIGLSTDGGQLNIAGDVDVIATSAGGEGAIGGDASGNTTRIAVTGGSLIIGGELTVETDVSGGDGVDGANAGDGGSGTGNTLLIDARNNDGGIPSLIRLGSLDIDTDVNGGSGGDGGAMADGGAGGIANGASAFVFGRAINGTLEVLGATDINVETRGGRGGDGVNGGDGGDALFGSTQFGTASGGPVPDLVEGAANFGRIRAEVVNIGGDGGDAATGPTGGVGGDGGDARQGFLTLLGRGAAVTAGDVDLIGRTEGGDGGDGATQGDGGFAAAATLSLAVSQAFENPGRGSMSLADLLIESTSVGGSGATAGGSQYSTGGGFTITQADVVINEIDINLGGETTPDFLVDDGMGALVPVTVNPFRFALDNATLNVGTFGIEMTTPGEINLIVADSTLSTRLFDITAASFFQPDPSDPPLTPGTLDITQTLNLTSTVGDIATQANLSAANGTNGAITLNSAGSIFVGDVTAPNVELIAPNGEIVTGIVNSGGGSVSLVTGDPIDLGSITADTVTAVSTGGDITSAGVLNVTGALDLTAAGSILLGDVTAGSVSATAQTGDIIFSGPLIAMGDIALNAAGLVQLAGLVGGTLIAESENGDIVADEPLDVSGFINLNAGGSIDLSDVTADSLEATTGQFGGVRLNGATVLNTTLGIGAGGTVELSDVTAGSVTAITLDGNVISSGTLNVTGLVDLQAPGDIQIAEVNAGSLNAQAANGVILFVNQNPLAISGALDLDAGGLIQFEAAVDAGSINAVSGDQIFAASALSASGGINLSASGPVTTSNIAADSLTVATGQFSNVILGGSTEVGGAVVIGSGGSVEVAEVTAGSLDATALDGNITATEMLNIAGLLDLDAVGSINLAGVDAGSLGASTQIGDITGADPIVVSGSATFNSGGNVALGDLTAAAITANAGDTVQVNGTWQAGLVNITAANLQLMTAALVDAGMDGTINLTSTNDQGVLLADSDSSGIARFVVDADTLSQLQTGRLVVAGAANIDGADIEIGDLDLSSSTMLSELSLRTNDAQGDILVSGIITASAGNGPIGLTFTSGQFAIDTATGGIDLLDNGGVISIFADTIAIGETDLFDALTGDETEEELFALLSARAATARPDGVLNGAAINLSAGNRILVQNTGTEEVAAGIVTTTSEGLSINTNRADPENLLFIVHAQINDGAGNLLTGDEAATAIIESLPDDAVFAAGSRFNGCELGGCDAVDAPASDQGEITSTVSAAISGTGSNSGSGSTGGSSGSGDSGADAGGGDDSGSNDGSDDVGGSSAGANTGSNNSGSNGGGDVSPDNVDDGGGGNEDFVIEDTDDGSSDSGSGSDDSDGGSSDSDGDSESSGEDSDSEAEGDESEAEESEDSEETEESEEEEAEEEEEEAAEEDEEESEGPASGPIAPPVSIINTSTLDRRGAINDPISGSGNPALIDPDIDVPANDGNGEQP